MTAEQQIQQKCVQVPDFNDTLRPVDDIFYNDIDTSRVFSHATGKKYYVTHTEISRLLANQLNLNMLSDLQSEELEIDSEDDVDFSLNEDMTIRINGLLKDYDMGYSFNEFVANADDAGASAVTFLLDERSFPTAELLKPQLDEFQSCPALLIYNDKQFTKQDFDGIVNTRCKVPFISMEKLSKKLGRIRFIQDFQSLEKPKEILNLPRF